MASLTAVVADASALVDLLFDPDDHPLASFLADPVATVHAPHLADVEVTSVLRRLVNRHGLRPQRAGEALSDYADLPLTRHEHLPWLPRVLELRTNFSAYDAIYVALAESMGATLVTADQRLGRAAGRLLGLTVTSVGTPS